MANSAIPKDTFVGDAEYILRSEEPNLPNSISMEDLPPNVAENPDIVMVQKGGLGGEVVGVPVSSFPSGGGGGLMPWNDVSDDTNMVSNNGYIIRGNRGMSLPPVSVVGDILRLVGQDNVFTLKQGADQTVSFNTDVTTQGVTGTLTPVAIGETLEIVCVTANLDWRVISSVGNLFTIV